MTIAGRLPGLLFCIATTPGLAAQAPTFQQITSPIQAGLEALSRGDTAGYLAGTGRAFSLGPDVPPVAYHRARALALGGRRDSAKWRETTTTTSPTHSSAASGTGRSSPGTRWTRC